MILRQFSTTLFLLMSLCSISQANKTFKLSDSSFSIGQKHRLSILYQVGSYRLHQASKSTVDSLYDFLTTNKRLAIEIGVHADGRLNPNRSMHLTQRRAQEIADSLVTKGIDPKRLYSKGYEDTQLLISNETINKTKTLEEKETLHQINRRTEIKIISVDFKR